MTNSDVLQLEHVPRKTPGGYFSFSHNHTLEPHSGQGDEGHISSPLRPTAARSLSVAQPSLSGPEEPGRTGRAHSLLRPRTAD